MEWKDLEKGLLIAFNHKVRARDINSHTFQVLIRTKNDDGWVTWRELPHKQLRGIELELAEESQGACHIIGREEEEGRYDADALVNGALFQVKDIPEEFCEEDLFLRVVLKGDFIRDKHGLGVDANHLPPWLPHRPSGDGIEGGTFESWFTVEEEEDEEDDKGRERRDRDGRQGRQRRRS
jgi:hypothetical protein